ncbi:hypothetical protein RvY_11632-2 [Ramazzottius varieornatus]|uniref:Uncharacterized protein n=1 Tax=Ramazzottius varieornatus TaxID=947166 RepID=A0A1D1VQK3_RAMVA|nr:hypothetical protein RvY_11632-2 [Ramazzottius varieornatus]
MKHKAQPASDRITSMLSESASENTAVEKYFPEEIFDANESTASTSGKSLEKVDFDQVSHISPADSPQPTVSPLNSLKEVKGDFVPDKPFLYASNCYRVVMLYGGRTRANIGNGDILRSLLRKSGLCFARLFVPPTKPHMAFVEVEEILDGVRAIDKLRNRYASDPNGSSLLGKQTGKE